MEYFYETMYILRPDLNEEAVDQAIEKYQTILREKRSRCFGDAASR